MLLRYLQEKPPIRTIVRKLVRLMWKLIDSLVFLAVVAISNNTRRIWRLDLFFDVLYEQDLNSKMWIRRYARGPF